MKVHVIRTAMIGGGLSYDVYVPLFQCPESLAFPLPEFPFAYEIKATSGKVDTRP